MKVLDLSRRFENNMPVFPGALEVSIEPLSRVAEQGYHVNKVVFNSHTGTHVDAPFHMKADGNTLDQLPAAHFLGEALCITLENPPGSFITLKHLEPFAAAIAKVDFVIFYTGWQKFWGTDAYVEGFPCLNKEAVEWLCSFNLKGIGLDTISVDPMDAEVYTVHHTLFAKNMIIVENLCNLDRLEENTFLFSALPLNITGGDGCPVRAVAIFP